MSAEICQFGALVDMPRGVLLNDCPLIRSGSIYGADSAGGTAGGPAQMKPAWPAAPYLECLRQIEGQRRQDVSPRKVGLFIHRDYSKRAFVGAPPIRASTIKWLGVQHLPCGSSLRKFLWDFGVCPTVDSSHSRLDF